MRRISSGMVWDNDTIAHDSGEEWNVGIILILKNKHFSLNRNRKIREI